MPFPPKPQGGMVPLAPPPDVETISGVKRYLGMVGSMNEKKLGDLVTDIWGEGYRWSIEDTERVRHEAIGFLLDQLDLLETLTAMQVIPGEEPLQADPQNSPHSSVSSLNSPPSLETEQKLSQEDSLSNSGSTLATSTS